MRMMRKENVFNIRFFLLHQLFFKTHFEEERWGERESIFYIFGKDAFIMNVLNQKEAIL